MEMSNVERKTAILKLQFRVGSRPRVHCPTRENYLHLESGGVGIRDGAGAVLLFELLSPILSIRIQPDTDPQSNSLTFQV